MPPLPSLPLMLPDPAGIIWQDAGTDSAGSKAIRITATEARKRITGRRMFFCHRRRTAALLGVKAGALEGPDGLELFAFTRPARFCLPTPQGLADALGIAGGNAQDDDPGALASAFRRALGMLLDELTGLDEAAKKEATAIARMMAAGGWGWGDAVLAALGAGSNPATPPRPDAAIAIIAALPEIPIPPPRPDPGGIPVAADAVAARLTHMLGQNAEIRPGQKAYAGDCARAFDTPGEHPHIVLAEAGTGTGKTLGYLAPATLWAEANEAPVWVSTYTRNLQHQVITEAGRLYPDRAMREAKAVALKGRENYLCLLNLEDALTTLPADGIAARGRTPHPAIGLGLMLRWAVASRDGDLTGPGYPAWLGDLMEGGAVADLADRRGECIHSACRHYNRCFTEKSRAAAKAADIIVANHALVLVRAAMHAQLPAQDSAYAAPHRIVFDEGHHVFDAADSAFAISFSGRNAAELRRWIRGAEGIRGHGGGARSRARGLGRRLEDIVMDKPEARADLDALIEAAACLPAGGWQRRISDAAPEGQVEAFLYELRRVIYDRVSSPESIYGLEAGLYPLDPRLAAMLPELVQSLGLIARPLARLAGALTRLLADETINLDSQTRARIEGAARGLLRHGKGQVEGWVQLLEDMATRSEGEHIGGDGVGGSGGDGMGDNPFVDWMEVTRRDGRDTDIGLCRHLLDPSRAFAALVLEQTAGAVITSATLTDTIADPDTMARERDWDSARRLTGAAHLPGAPALSDTASPFDYAGQTRVLVIDDLSRDDLGQTAAAMAGLMRAAGGGGLGLFTAIRRLREAHPLIAAELREKRIPLYAQHVDAMNLQTLLRIFRMEPAACLLGTDAVRDGIDVPGRALQLIIFDRVPWPRPDILYKARAAHFGREAWADRGARMRLRQAYGRLVRRGDDRGVFVMLDSRLPSRLATAFPEGVEIRRLGIKQAIRETADFLGG